MLKKKLWATVMAVLIMTVIMQAKAGTVHAASDDFYVPLSIAYGFNIDGVLEDGSGARADALDGGNYTYYAQTDRAGSLPPGGIIRTSGGKYFKLGKYNEMNVLRLNVAGTPLRDGTLSPDENSQMACKSLSFLATGGNRGAKITARVRFEDTSEICTQEFNVQDWDTSVGDSSSIVYKCGRVDLRSLSYETGEKFGLYEYTIDIPDALQGYPVTALNLELTTPNSSNPTVCFFAVSAIPAADIYSVIFDENGGTLAEGTSDIVRVNPGETIQLPDIERAGYVFDGWYDGDTKAGDIGDSYTVSDNKVLQARWKGKYIWYYQDENDQDPVKLIQNEDGTYDHPEKDNYTFRGFAATPNGTIIDDGDLELEGTYYAVWEENPFILLYTELDPNLQADIIPDKKWYLDEDHLIINRENLPEIGDKLFYERLNVEGYFSDAGYTKLVDVLSAIPDDLIGKPIYLKLTEPDPPISVKRVGVTKENQANVLGDQNKSVSFDYDTFTLTLNNANIYFDGEIHMGIVIGTVFPVTIHLEGENTITAGDVEILNSAGIYSSAPLKIEGPGSLIISLNRNGESRSEGISIGGDLTLCSDADVKVDADRGIYYDYLNDYQLDVQAGSRLEVTSAKGALLYGNLTDATKALGVQIKTSADAPAYEPWDGTSELNSEDIKCILIPGKEISHVKAKKENCGEAGNPEYWAVTENGETRYYSDVELKNEITSPDDLIIPAVGEHIWDQGKVTKAPTETAEGVRTYTCTVCGKKKTEGIAKLKPAPAPAPGSDPNQKGSDGTAVGPGASAAAAEKAITSMKSDADPKGTVFAGLKLKSPSQTKTSIKLNWTKVSKAKKYVIYGNKCGKTNKPKKLAVVTGRTKTVKKAAGKKIKKGTYYKFIVVALDKNNNVVSTSKVIHIATKGGKVGNHKSVTVKKAVLTKAKKLRKGKTLKLNAKAKARVGKLKVRTHVKIRYESTNKKIATVSGKGLVRARKKGTCYVYAYAQNGVFRKIKISVK